MKSLGNPCKYWLKLVGDRGLEPPTPTMSSTGKPKWKPRNILEYIDIQGVVQVGKNLKNLIFGIV
jgi:hypothetical protein